LAGARPPDQNTFNCRADLQRQSLLRLLGPNLAPTSQRMRRGRRAHHLTSPAKAWVAHPRYALPVAVALRQSLIELSNSRFVQQGQETKMEQVYKYLTGMKFRQRVEAVIEKFEDMRGDLDRERRFKGKQWSKREAQILAVVDSTVGMVGDLQGIAGRLCPRFPASTCRCSRRRPIRKREYRDWHSAVQRNDVMAPIPDFGRCVLLLQRLLTQSLPKRWVIW
jgi:hypothetical protein